MARKGLPKKYAKMGFKKGWREYKKSKRGGSTKRRTSTRTKSTRKRTYRRKSSMRGLSNPLMKGIIAGAGANLIKKYVNVPFADDLAVLGVGYFMKDKTLQTIGAVGLGSDLTGFLPGGNGNGNGGYLG